MGPATYLRFLLLKKITKWDRSDVVLDVGCGSGRFIQLLSPLVREIHGIDISEEALKIARNLKINNAFLRKGNALKIPYKDNFFDKVICIDVIEHIEDDEKVLKEIKRVLKKGGEGIVYFVAGTLNPSIGHFHSYNFSSIVNLARKLDLRIKKLITYRSILDKIINPLRKPIKYYKLKACILSELITNFMFM
ncbi:MAG: class I SAM-dependent methyltransferase [Candidatus Omnitrophica bacterium]|nr:class I SAM-dependent methyltransferase [Candidatus Omnitrophota bacterium]